MFTFSMICPIEAFQTASSVPSDIIFLSTSCFLPWAVPGLTCPFSVPVRNKLLLHGAHTYVHIYTQRYLYALYIFTFVYGNHIDIFSTTSNSMEFLTFPGEKPGFSILSVFAELIQYTGSSFGIIALCYLKKIKPTKWNSALFKSSVHIYSNIYGYIFLNSKFLWYITL